MFDISNIALLPCALSAHDTFLSEKGEKLCQRVSTLNTPQTANPKIHEMNQSHQIWLTL